MSRHLQILPPPSVSLTISLQAVYRTLTEALAKWPRDALRPDCQLHDVVGKRIERGLAQSGGNATEAHLKQVNALFSLLENRYQTKVRKQRWRTVFRDYRLTWTLVPDNWKSDAAQEQPDVLYRPFERTRGGTEPVMVREDEEQVGRADPIQAMTWRRRAAVHFMPAYLVQHTCM